MIKHYATLQNVYSLRSANQCTKQIMTNVDTTTVSVWLNTVEIALITITATVDGVSAVLDSNMSVALRAPRRVAARCAACSSRVRRSAIAQCVEAATNLQWITRACETVTACREQPRGGARCSACATFVRGWGSAADVLSPHRATHNNTIGCVAPDAARRKWIADMLSECAAVFHVRTDSVSDCYAVRCTAMDFTQLANAVRVALLVSLQTEESQKTLATCDADHQLAQALRRRAGIAMRSALGWISAHET